jgi:HEAT repeat protein
MPLFHKQTASQAVVDDERKQGRELPDLLEQLEREDAVARRWAARDLGAYPESAPELISRTKVEPDPSVREMLLTSLIGMGASCAVEGLVECLRSEDVALRNATIDVLAHFPERTSPLVGQLLGDPDPDVRIFAVDILRRLEHPDVERWVVEGPLKDPHVNVCAAALEILATTATERSRQALQEVKERFSQEPFLVFGVDLALARIQKPAS